jgi:hypothetical protein
MSSVVELSAKHPPTEGFRIRLAPRLVTRIKRRGSYPGKRPGQRARDAEAYHQNFLHRRADRKVLSLSKPEFMRTLNDAIAPATLCSPCALQNRAEAIAPLGIWPTTYALGNCN